MRSRSLPYMIAVLLLLLLGGFQGPATARPAHSIRAEGRVQGQNPSRPPADFFIETSFSKTRFHVGEAVTLTITWYQAGEVDHIALGIPSLAENGFSVSNRSCGHSADCLEMPLGNRTVMVEKAGKTIAEKQYTAFSFQEVLVAHRPGKFTFPGAAITFSVVGYKKAGAGLKPTDPAFMEGLFTPGARIEKDLSARSRPENLVVKPLPEKGKPSNFNGAVGRFRLKTSISARKFAIGSPVTLKMEVEGDCEGENIPPPLLSKIPELTDSFGVPDQMAPGTPAGKSRIFTQTLWPETAGKSVIPAITYAYFDPEKQCYRIARSEPIPIEAAATPTGIRQLWRRRALFGNDTLRCPIAPNYEGTLALLNRNLPLDTLESPAWILSVVLPPMGFSLLFLFRRQVRKSPEDIAALRAKRAYGAFSRQLQRESFRNENRESCMRLIALIKNYLRDKLGVATDNLTSADLESLLRGKGVDVTLVSQIGYILAACDRCKFAGRPEADEDLRRLVETIPELLGNLDRHLNSVEPSSYGS